MLSCGRRREKPEQKTQVRTFFNYYLPTSVKLFETYADLTGSGIQTASVTRTKKERSKRRRKCW